MSRAVVALALVAMLPPVAVGAEKSDSSDKPPSATKSVAAAQWRSDARAAVRAAASSSAQEQRNAARRLVALYKQVDGATFLANEDRAYWKSLIGRRLKQAGEQLARKARPQPLPGLRAAAAADDGERPRLLAEIDQLVHNAVAPNGWADRAVLGQQLPVNRFGAAGLGPLGGAGAPQQPNDYGDELVDLIQATIAPSTWDVNGGLGTIRYFRPLRVLVVRQTAEVHEQLGGLIGALRN